MFNIPYIFAVLVLLFAALITVTIWSRRSLFWRAGCLLVGAVTMAVGYVALVDLLSRPKPTMLEFRHQSFEDFEILYTDWTEGEGIYLLLRLPGEAEPRYYALPWNIATAERLQEAIEEAGEKKTELRVGNPFFDPDVEDRERLFYTTPQSAAARKGLRDVDPTKFDPEAEKRRYGADGEKPDTSQD